MDLHATSNILRTPLHYAVVQQDTTSALITLGAKVFIVCCVFLFFSLFFFLMFKFFSLQLDASDQDGITPLHFAASKGGVAVKELRKAGAKMEEVDKGILSFLSPLSVLLNFIFPSILFPSAFINRKKIRWIHANISCGTFGTCTSAEGLVSVWCERELCSS